MFRVAGEKGFIRFIKFVKFIKLIASRGCFIDGSISCR